MDGNVDSSRLPILVATVPVAAERLRRIFATHRVACPATYDEAARLITQKQFSLAVLGVYFAGSRMFDLLSCVRGSAKNRRTPIACVVGLRGDLSPLVIRSLEQTVSAMPRSSFLNLAAIPDDPAGNEMVLSFLSSLLATPVRATT
jgi:hypothetical protein